MTRKTLNQPTQIYFVRPLKCGCSEKLQTLNAEFRRKFSVTLGDIVADHEDY
jgi:hypothetical protein